MTQRGGDRDRGRRRNAGRPGSEPPRQPGRPGNARQAQAGHGLGIRRLAIGDYELVHPACVEERREDYEEGLEIWRAGDRFEAREALRFALEGCGDNLWVHVALGRIALEGEEEPALARGHFGYAYELGLHALPRGFQGRLPRSFSKNQPFFEAIEGLARCLAREGNAQEADQLRRQAARWAGEQDLPE